MKSCGFQFASVVLALLSFVFTVPAWATTRYVDVNNLAPAAPYLDWSTAATNIQHAIDVAANGDLILVTNGVYASGGRVKHGSLTNRVVVDKAITLQSVNGPAETIIRGFQPARGVGANAIRCVYLTNNAMLIGFTLTNGGTHNSNGTEKERYGGGIYCESTQAVVSNCIIIRNAALTGGGGTYSGTINNCDLILNTTEGNGGGAKFGRHDGCRIAFNSSVFNNGGGTANSISHSCLIVSNTAPGLGGGSFQGTQNNCTIVGNQAGMGAGVYGEGPFSPSVNSCIIYDNYNGSVLDNWAAATLNYCCSVPAQNDTLFMIMNISNAPAFTDPANGDFRLQSMSPCINSGRNRFATGAADFDGHPRIVGLSVDIGAYEFQSPSSVLSFAWAQQYGFPLNGTEDFSDPDSDGLNNWQEWIVGSTPTNSQSLLAMVSITRVSNGIRLAWQSGLNRNYFLERSTNLLAQPAFSVILSNYSGASHVDNTAPGGTPLFYRIRVQ